MHLSHHLHLLPPLHPHHHHPVNHFFISEDTTTFHIPVYLYLQEFGLLFLHNCLGRLQIPNQISHIFLQKNKGPNESCKRST